MCEIRPTPSCPTPWMRSKNMFWLPLTSPTRTLSKLIDLTMAISPVPQREQSRCSPNLTSRDPFSQRLSSNGCRVERSPVRDGQPPQHAGVFLGFAGGYKLRALKVFGLTSPGSPSAAYAFLTTTAVPPAIILFGSALVGLAGLAWQSRRKSSMKMLPPTA